MAVRDKIWAPVSRHPNNSVLPPQSLPLFPGVGEGDTYYFSFIDRIHVVDGVYHGEELHEANDMVVGDEYKFPTHGEQAHSEIVLVGCDAHVRVLDTVEIGQSRFLATRTHDLTLMSEHGTVLNGHVLKLPSGRGIVALQEVADTTKGYTLIANSMVLSV